MKAIECAWWPTSNKDYPRFFESNCKDYSGRTGIARLHVARPSFHVYCYRCGGKIVRLKKAPEDKNR